MAANHATSPAGRSPTLEDGAAADLSSCTPPRMTYAFLVGCSRSGTSALVRLVNASEHAAVGLERYKHRRLEIAPEDFSRDRFFEFRSQDTNVTPSGARRWAELYRTLEGRWDAGTVSLTGDKVGPSPAVAAHLEDSFDHPKFVFIYRDLERVASSFTARALNPRDTRWPSHRRHKHALLDWHAGFEAAALLLTIARDRVFVVRYETLFSGDLDCARALFRFLALPWTDEMQRSFVERTADWERYSSKPLQLSKGARRYLHRNARREIEECFDELAVATIQRWRAKLDGT